jgi:hypothetical protein
MKILDSFFRINVFGEKPGAQNIVKEIKQY